MLWEGLHNCSCGDCKIIPQCEPNPEKEKSYSKFQAFPPAEMEAGRGTLEGEIGRGRGLVCVRSGKVIEEFINCRRALKQLHLRLRVGGGECTINPTTGPPFSREGDCCPFCGLFFYALKIDVKIKAMRYSWSFLS